MTNTMWYHLYMVSKETLRIRSDKQSAWGIRDGGLWHWSEWSSSDQDHHQEKQMQKGKMVVWLYK